MEFFSESNFEKIIKKRNCLEIKFSKIILIITDAAVKFIRF